MIFSDLLALVGVVALLLIAFQLKYLNDNLAEVIRLYREEGKRK